MMESEGIVFTQPCTLGRHEHLTRSEGTRHLEVLIRSNFWQAASGRPGIAPFGQWLPICLSVSEPSGNGDASDGFIMIHQLV